LIKHVYRQKGRKREKGKREDASKQKGLATLAQLVASFDSIAAGTDFIKFE
jgi:hypothetical protein